MTELNSIVPGLSSPWMLVKPAEMDCFIYFVAERPHKALEGTLQPSLQNGYSQKCPGPNLGVTFSMRANI